MESIETTVTSACSVILNPELRERQIRMMADAIRAERGPLFVFTEEESRKFVEYVHRAYHRAIITPNRAIGVDFGSAYSEANTQCALNAFHMSGVGGGSEGKANVTLGFPRMLELFNATKDIRNPSCRFMFKNKHTLDEAYMGAKTIENVSIETFLLGIEAMDRDTTYPWYSFYRKNVCKVLSDDEPGYAICMTFNMVELYRHSITLFDIVERIHSHYADIYACCSPDSIGKVIAVLPRAEIPETSILMYLRFSIDKLKRIWISGIHGIAKCYVQQIKEAFVVETEGSNLRALMANASIMFNNTYSNDIMEVYHVLGIEATREVLIKEIRLVLENSGINNMALYIIEFIVDTMCMTGFVKPVSRYGISNDVGCLAKACFEQCMSVITDNALLGKVDPLRSISANIALGKLIPAGTGSNIELYNKPVSYPEWPVLDVEIA